MDCCIQHYLLSRYPEGGMVIAPDGGLWLVTHTDEVHKLGVWMPGLPSAQEVHAHDFPINVN